MKAKSPLLKLLSATILSATLAMGGCATQPTPSPEATGPLSQAETWVQSAQAGEAPVTSKMDLAALGKMIMERSSGTMVDLTKLPLVVPRARVVDEVSSEFSGLDPSAPPPYFGMKDPISRADFQAALANCNLSALPERVKAEMCLALRRTSVRGLPQDSGWYETPGDVNYDMLQLLVLDPGEPVIAYAKSADGTYTFVRTAWHHGWVHTQDLVKVGRKDFLRYASPKDFFVVTADEATASVNGEQLLFEMGARLPAAKVQGKAVPVVPTSVGGKFREVPAGLAEAAISHGYLPLTRANIIAQAFKSKGHEYGWGGLNNGVDCSAFVHNVLATMGVSMPLNSTLQIRSIPRTYELGESTPERDRRLAIVGIAKPGDLLHKKGHIMIYLGADPEGNPMVIHSLSSYYDPAAPNGRNYLRKVIVSRLDFLSDQEHTLLSKVARVGSLF